MMIFSKKLVSYYRIILSFVAYSFFLIAAQAQTVRYIHSDGLGSVSTITDASRIVIERREYEPYGAGIGLPVDGVGYTGHVMDAATSLVYMQQRYYDPQVGMMLSADPISAYQNPIANFCRYCYARNNPYLFKDPDGRQAMGAPRDFYNPINEQQARQLVPLILDFTPVIGDVKGIVDAYNNPSMASIGGALVGLGGPAGDAAGKALKNIDNIADAAKAIDKLPKPPTGPGSVAKADRDPKRFFSPPEREAKRVEQGNQCANGCGTQIDGSNSAGHHKVRHADGGRTTSENHAEVCDNCHRELHSGN